MRETFDLSPEQAIQQQKQLQQQVQITPLKKEPRYIAGADISYDRFSSYFIGVIVVYDLAEKIFIEKVWHAMDVNFPYIPGLLSYREIPILLEAYDKLQTDVDVFILDGHGIAHPRSIGVASHFGLMINKPSMGCAKKILKGDFLPPANEKGATSEIYIGPEKRGYAYRSRKSVKPIFISPGHKIDFDSCLNLIEKLDSGFRIPLPTREAHLFANQKRIEIKATH